MVIAGALMRSVGLEFFESLGAGFAFFTGVEIGSKGLITGIFLCAGGCEETGAAICSVWVDACWNRTGPTCSSFVSGLFFLSTWGKPLRIWGLVFGIGSGFAREATGKPNGEAQR